MRYRLATKDDLPQIVAMLLDDTLGARREVADDPAYGEAFDAIQTDPNQELWVIDAGRDRVVGFLQMTFIQGLGRKAALRVLIESVRVLGELRGQGLGTAFLRHVIERARDRGAALVQLTTDKTRKDAYRFYVALGFEPSHEGMKFYL